MLPLQKQRERIDHSIDNVSASVGSRRKDRLIDGVLDGDTYQEALDQGRVKDGQLAVAVNVSASDHISSSRDDIGVRALDQNNVGRGDFAVAVYIAENLSRCGRIGGLGSLGRRLSGLLRRFGRIGRLVRRSDSGRNSGRVFCTDINRAGEALARYAVIGIDLSRTVPLGGHKAAVVDLGDGGGVRGELHTRVDRMRISVCHIQQKTLVDLEISGALAQIDMANPCFDVAVEGVGYTL